MRIIQRLFRNTDVLDEEFRNMDVLDGDGKYLWEPYKGYLYDENELKHMVECFHGALEIMDSYAIRLEQMIEEKKQYIEWQKTRWNNGERW